MVSEPHPTIHSIPIQSTPVQKHSAIPGFMALTDRKNDPTDRMGKPSGEGVMGQNCPSTAGLASRDGCQGQARARERGLNRRQGPRSGDSNDRTRNCPPPQDMATLYHRERARQHRSMLFGFSWSRPSRSGLRWDTAPDSLVSSAVVGLRPVRAEHFQFRASHVPALSHGSRGNLGVPIAADLLDVSNLILLSRRLRTHVGDRIDGRHAVHGRRIGRDSVEQSIY